MSKFYKCFAIVLAATLALSAQSAHAQTEASKVRILIVVDTLDRLGAWWEQDGINLQAMFEKGFNAQGLRGRYTIDVFTGGSVHPAEIKKYYQNLRIGKNDTLVFYYSGHGGYHRSRGHFLALTRGAIFRSEIASLMSRHNPRQSVILTDCCATFTNFVRRPANSSGMRGAQFTEPSGVQLLPVDIKSNKPRKKARVAEPPVIVVKAGLRKRPSSGLKTRTGIVSFTSLLTNVDGKGMRQLFFGERGNVDINGSRKGTPSLGGPPRDGGSFFTRALLLLQHKNQYAKMDSNRDRRLQWKELYNAVRAETERLTNRRQSPEAWNLPGGITGPKIALLGKTIKGNLTGRVEKHKYYLLAGSKYTFSMTGQFDTFLKLYNPNGQLVASDDDSGTGRNAKLTYTAPTAGTYVIACTSYLERGRGTYELQISSTVAQPIKLTKVLPGNLVGRERRVPMTFTAGKVYLISMNSTAFDPYLKVLDPNGRLVALDDDDGPGLNAQVRYLAPRTGTYTIVCTSYRSRGRGRYVLSVRQLR